MPNGHCWYWKDVGYCGSGSIYYSFMSTNCQYTCRNCPTNKYSNCDVLKDAGYCSYSFSDGTTVAAACPQSCGVSTMASFQMLSELPLDPAANALIMPKEVVGEPWQTVQPPMGN